jgi:hypothetical protein
MTGGPRLRELTSHPAAGGKFESEVPLRDDLGGRVLLFTIPRARELTPLGRLPDLSWDAEDAVIGRAAELFVDIPDLVEVRNEARVHLWYEQHFGVPAEPFTSTTDAVDNFASTTCCFAITQDSHGQLQVYAPHGYDDLLAQRMRPNPRLAPREVYERKAARWTKEWPGLIVDPWPHSRTQ